jgi:hypothetical protein
MKNQHLATLLVAPLFATSAPAQQVLAWAAVEKLARGTPITVVETYKEIPCTFERATDDELFCSATFVGAAHSQQTRDFTFKHNEIGGVQIDTPPRPQSDDVDLSKGPLIMVFATGAGGGWDSAHQSTAFGGVKLGVGGLTMDLQYDRLNAQNGFSVEGSGLIPLFRFPAFRPGNDHLLLKVLAEPGLGYRAGPGPFGQYASAKALVLLGNKWALYGGPSPYIEFQRRVPFNSPLDGDNRFTVGIMWAALCWQCGGDN